MPSERKSLLDHVIVAVRDLDAAAQSYRRLGFTLSDLGRHPGRGTVNRCIAFPNGYLELLGPGEDCAEAFLLDFLGRREGAASIALAMEDPALVFSRLRTVLPDLQAPVTGSREIHATDGVHVISFDVQRVEPDALLPGRFFFCAHRDRERVYAPELFQHANGARELARVVIAAEPGAIRWTDAWEQLGYRLIERSGDRLRIDCGGVELAFVHPGCVRSEVSVTDMPQIPPAPAIVLLEFDASCDQRVAAAAAHGVVLAFKARR
jgi:catechol 2,3-dioxygenase-like lactoylglutathione lyase family enzyme